MSKEEELRERGLALRQDDQSFYRQGKSYFFGIGIDEYEDQQHFPKLENAVFDVKAIKDELSKHFEFSECNLLLNNEAEGKVIYNVLDAFTEELEEWDKLLIYFAGHGGRKNGTGRPFWAPYDATLGNPHSLLENFAIRTLIHECPARHVLLISDSCNSGSFLETTRSLVSYPKLDDRQANEYEKSLSRWALCSTDGNQLATDGRKGFHTPFARTILQFFTAHRSSNFNVGFFIDWVVKTVNKENEGQSAKGGELPGIRHGGGQYVFRPRLSVQTSSAIPDSRKKVATPDVIKHSISEIKQNFKTTSSRRERVKLLFKAAQLQKQHPKQTAFDQLVNDLLQAIEKEERSLFLKKKESSDYSSFPSLQPIIPLLTKKILDNMEDYLRKSCELMLHDLKIPILNGRRALRDFCESKSDETEFLIQEINTFKEKSKDYSVGSDMVYDRTHSFATQIKKKLGKKAFLCLTKAKNEDLTNTVNRILKDLNYQNDQWLILANSDDSIPNKDILFQHQIKRVLIQLELIKGLLDIISSKTLELDFSLS